ncbi:MAG: adenylate/guanylate cyclase domain-containing protein [Blastocatellia bacterium]|nr:adenylate/guanylate cyclase domain-containing protein [Blastocatellia bacterium]
MKPASAKLTALIARRSEPGADVEALDREIWATFGETWAVLFSDMSDFTERTERNGITYFLTLIHHMHRLLKPVVAAHEGRVLKTEADDLFTLFPTAEQAVRCAREMHLVTAAYNAGKAADFQISVCLGIGFGEVLKIGDEDCFGDEVNHASKLSEDVAKANETLLTPKAFAALAHLNDLCLTRIETGSQEIVPVYYRLEP